MGVGEGRSPAGDWILSNTVAPLFHKSLPRLVPTVYKICPLPVDPQISMGFYGLFLHFQMVKRILHL